MTTNTTVTDPICGMDIDPADAAGSSTYEGQTYYFCNLNCKVTFDKAPAEYAGPAPATSCCGGGQTSCC